MSNHIIHDTAAYETLLRSMKSMKDEKQPKDNTAILELLRKNRREYLVIYK